MAVLVPCKADDAGVYPDGAYCPIERSYDDPLSGVPTGWKNAVCAGYQVREVFVGRVLATGERNGYDDSDFTALVWDDEKQDVETIVYATTRFPTYHLYAHVDASPEVVAKAEALRQRRVRASLVMGFRRASKRRAEIARTLGVKMSAVRRLELCRMTPEKRERVIQLTLSFKAGRLRSEFKKSLAQRVIDWLADPEPAYDTPLSRNQLDYV